MLTGIGETYRTGATMLIHTEESLRETLRAHAPHRLVRNESSGCLGISGYLLEFGRQLRAEWERARQGNGFGTKFFCIVFVFGLH
jgi:hypothetical protein